MINLEYHFVTYIITHHLDNIMSSENCSQSSSLFQIFLIKNVDKPIGVMSNLLTIVF